MAKETKSKDAKKERNKASEPRVAVPPIYKVVAGGVTVDFDDKFQNAQATYNEAAAKPKYLYSVFGRDVKCLAAAL